MAIKHITLAICSGVASILSWPIPKCRILQLFHLAPPKSLLYPDVSGIFHVLAWRSIFKSHPFQKHSCILSILNNQPADFHMRDYLLPFGIHWRNMSCRMCQCKSQACSMACIMVFAFYGLYRKYNKHQHSDSHKMVLLTLHPMLPMHPLV